ELMKSEQAVFVEVGPGRTLSTFARSNAMKGNGHHVVNLSRHIHEEIADDVYLLDKIGRLWVIGVEVIWAELYSGDTRKRISLPTYPFERDYYWTKDYHLNDLMKKIGNRSNNFVDVRVIEDRNDIETILENDVDKIEVVQEQRYKRPEVSTAYEGPRDEIEGVLADICSEIMEIDKIGIHDDFFELGGDSLGAITLCGKIQSKLKVDITVVDIFQNPTVAEIADFIRETQSTKYLAIEPATEKEYYAASPAQRRLYTLQELDKDNIAYNLPGTFVLEGVIDTDKINGIFVQLIKRHEALRTSFGSVDGEPVQYIHKDGVFELQLYNSTEESLDSLIRDFIKPFDLSEKTLFRAGLIKLANDKHILIIDMHHIVSDGISLSILIKEFTQLYKGKELEPVKIQYKDYSEWLYNTLTKDEQKNFWINQFKGDIPILNLIGDSPRPATKSYEGGRFSLKIDEKLTQRLKTTCKSTDATLYMMLLSAYNVLLAKYSGQEDIIIGSPIVGRHSGDLNDVMGIFVNTLAMRNHPVKEKTFKEFLAQVKKNALGAYENQDYPFEELVKNLNVKRDMSRNPLFDVMFTMLSMTMSTQAIEGLIIKPYVYEYNMSKVDMELLVTEKEACIEIEIVYATKIFNKKTIQRFAAHYEHILNQITENTEVKLSDIQLATAAEKKQIIEVFNDTEADYPKGKTIHQLFQEQVEKTPHHIAVTYEDQSYNYVELNRKANQLARVLVSKGVKTDTIVGIMVERSIEMIVGIMAIVKAGGAYLPIEPVYPIDRIMFMLEDSNATILLTQSWLSDSIKFDGDTLMIDQSSLYVGDEHNLDLEQDAASLAYVIYTSGSTGNPKGVMIQHRSLVNRLNWMQRKFPIGEGDVILQKTPFTFDVSLWEVFWWSMVGASVHMLEPGGEKDPELLVKTIEKRSITTMHFVPSMLSIFLEYVKNNQKSCDLSTLNQVFASGEALLKNQVDLFSTLIESKFGTALINLYGPTEATVDVSYYECRQLNDKQSVPIGRPIDNTRIYITDDSLNLMPIGVPGELCISGDGLARGYINRPELTAERFVNNPYEPNGKMYRTGDLVRWYEDGNIEYLGRLDFQVKIRGYRIELGEIEGRLKEHKSIKDSVVVDLADEGGNKYLCAYIVSEDEVTIQSLKEHLYQDLPQYMIPSYFVHLENLPLSANGKINRKALPEPTHNLETGTVYVAPKNEIQEQILAVWQEILKNDKIGIADDFFTLGGDSFKALNAVSKLNGIISLADIFQYPTIELLWKHVFEAEREISLLNKLTTSNADENGTAIVCVPYGGGSSIIYKPLAEEIDKGGIKTDLYAINLPGHDTSDPGELDTILNIAKKCVEEIKKLIRKPVLLYGHCVGVGLTIEIARLLEEDEYPVIGIGIGAVLPVKSNVFVTPKIDVYESKSDEEVHKFLKSLGGFDYPMEVEELASLMASFRHDVVQMRKYFYTDYAGLNPKKLQAPVYNIIGTEDRLTRGYNKSYKKWMNYAETVNAPIVLEKAGHYFIKSHAKELAESISQIVASNEGKMTATVTAKQSHINCP
ncbi:MAG: hypothetical protein K0S04_556, partial [Herbinix sp.]|nr:hypothetical protein [Herbinix sp.]